jgi:O-antigen ligase/Tfp pilus assembly protein PilF
MIVPCHTDNPPSIAWWPRFARWSTIPSTVLLLGGLILFLPLIDGGTTQFPVMTMRLTVLAVACSWLIQQMKEGGIVFTPSPLLAVIAIFVAWATVSIGLTAYKNPSVQWLMSLFCYAALYAIVSQGIKTREQACQVLMVFVGMGMCEGLLGIAQYAYLGELRAKGTFFNPNFFATFEVAALAVTLGALHGLPWTESHRWKRSWLSSAAVVSFSGFVLAQSRGALWALFVAGLYIAWSRFEKKALIALALMIAVLAVIPNPLSRRVSEVSTQDPYAYTRVDIWKSSLERIAEHPWGIGLGMFKYASFQYRFPVDHEIARYGKRAESAHSGFLEIAVELGIVGLLMFLAGVAAWAGEVRKVVNSQVSPWERGLAVGGVAAVMAILSHAIVDSVFHEPSLVMTMIVVGGVILKFGPIHGRSIGQWRIPLSFHPARRALVLFFGVLLAILIIQPAAAWYSFMQGQVHAKEGRQDLAWDWLERASRIDPGTTGYHDALARAALQRFEESGDRQWLLRAVEEEQVAMELNPMDGRFPYRLGTMFDVLARQTLSHDQQATVINQAVEAYAQAKHIDPYSPLNYLRLADIAMEQGRKQEARSWLQEAIRYEPNYLPAHLRLAEMSLREGDVKDARAELDTIMAVQRRYQRRTMTDLERQFLDVDSAALERSLSGRGQP